ncbi:uncharacterized protein B0H18DRAFT_955939 [Fomitopsis serialis]|uniref:uncharacterized protein n=1 Tax=Fomitopsis serialis TaxID=139415 RepID=UPI0020085ABE|nr:uncharacterized protein B0H18DRAFT_955939 [Neoantrodia serialis]KAH9923244.1 hypothetical protein B0H18DRAFT_955939 [Neoantrodia serialis]
MAPSELPLEVQERALDHLHGDLKSLKSCSFICRAWTHTTRLHLLWTIVLNTEHDAIRFLSLLEESDQLGTGVASGVRELQLPMGDSYYQEHTEMTYELLRSISRRLPVVEVLYVKHFNITAFMEYLWSDDEAFNLQDAISSILVFPRLKAIHYNYLELRSTSELLEFLGAFPTVSSLHAHNISDHRRVEPWPLERTAIQDFVARRHQGCITIQDIMGDNFVTRLEALSELLAALTVPPFDLRLKRLGWTDEGMVAGWDDFLPVLVPMFRRAEATLEHLEFAFTSSDVWLEHLDLANHCRLKSLSLTFRLSSRDHWPHVPLFLSRITSTELRTVDFHFYSSEQHFLREFFDWPALSDALIALHRKCLTMTVTFYFCTYAGCGTTGIPDAIDPLRVRIASVLAIGMRVVVDRRVVTSKGGLFTDGWIPMVSKRVVLEA